MQMLRKDLSSVLVHSYNTLSPGWGGAGAEAVHAGSLAYVDDERGHNALWVF